MAVNTISMSNPQVCGFDREVFMSWVVSVRIKTEM